MKKRLFAVGLLTILAANLLYTSCAGAVEPLEDPRPVLKKIIPYTLADMNNDVAGKRME